MIMYMMGKNLCILSPIAIFSILPRLHFLFIATLYFLATALNFICWSQIYNTCGNKAVPEIEPLWQHMQATG